MTCVASVCISLAELDVHVVGEIEFSHKEGQRISGAILPVCHSTYLKKMLEIVLDKAMPVLYWDCY